MDPGTNKWAWRRDAHGCFIFQSSVWSTVDCWHVTLWRYFHPGDNEASIYGGRTKLTINCQDERKAYTLYCTVKSTLDHVTRAQPTSHAAVNLTWHINATWPVDLWPTSSSALGRGNWVGQARGRHGNQTTPSGILKHTDVVSTYKIQNETKYNKIPN